MKLLSTTFAVVLMAAIGAPMPALCGTALTLLSPADKSYVETELITVVLKVEKDSLDEVQLTLENGKVSPTVITVPVKRDYVCKGISLTPGANRIIISGLKKSGLIEEKKVDVFFRFELSKEHKKTPPDFKRLSFHTADNEKSCSPCHTTDPTETDKNPPVPDNSTCYPCHKRITAYEFVHGPASVWACLTCHETKTGGVKYIVEQPDIQSCYRCHKDNLVLWNAKKFRHGPSMVSCTVCHDPHASKRPFWVRLHATKLCVTCHEDRASGAHVIAGFAGAGHPTSGRPDPLRKGREFTCAGCHNPHAGDTPNLLSYDNSEMATFCTLCHQR